MLSPFNKQASTYIRVKRTNQTIFLYVEPTETLVDVKKKISAIVKTPVDNIRLLNTQHQPLQEDKTVADNKVENDQVVYWVQKKEGTTFSSPCFSQVFILGSDQWEEVNIQKIEQVKEAEEK